MDFETLILGKGKETKSIDFSLLKISPHSSSIPNYKDHSGEHWAAPQRQKWEKSKCINVRIWAMGRVGCRQAGLSETERYMRHIPKTAAPCKHVRTQTHTYKHTHTHARTKALRQAAKSIFNFYPFFKKSTRLLFWWQYNNMFPRVKNEQTPTSCRKRHKKCDRRILKNPVLPRALVLGSMRLLLLMIWSMRRN